MEVILLLSTVFFNGVLAQDGSVHFKIHIPEVIRRHVHTKTVLMHMVEPERPKHNEESHVEDWSSYNSYDYNDGVEEKRAGGFRLKKKQKKLSSDDDYMPIREEEPQYGYGPMDNALTGPDNPLGFFGPPIGSEGLLDPRNRRPAAAAGQYKIHEEVDEEAPSDEAPDNNAYNKLQEHGYHRGSKTEHGHVIQKDLRDFYDKENEEEELSRDAYENEGYSRYAKHGYRANYDKEIGLEQRAGNKHATRRRLLVARMLAG